MEEADKKLENDQLDLDLLIEVLDTALESDNPIVQDQLRKLLMVAALTKTAHPDVKVAGLFSKMRQDIEILANHVEHLENIITQIRGFQARLATTDMTATMAREYEVGPGVFGSTSSEVEDLMRSLNIHR